MIASPACACTGSNCRASQTRVPSSKDAKNGMPARNAPSSCARSVPLMLAASQPWRLPGNEGDTTPFRGVFILPNGPARCLDKTMTVVALLTRAGLRARWRTWLVLAVLTGLAGGLVTAVAAGARRTDAAYPARVAWSQPPDDLVSVSTGSGSSVGPAYSNVPAAAIAGLPQVIASAPAATYTVLEPAAATLGAPLNGTVPGTFWHRKLLAGRLPDARQPDEVDVSFTVTQALPHLQVGDTLPLLLLGAKGEPVRVNLRVVGIEGAPAEFPPQYGPGVDFIWATPAFVEAYGARLLGSPGVAV